MGYFFVIALLAVVLVGLVVYYWLSRNDRVRQLTFLGAIGTALTMVFLTVYLMPYQVPAGHVGLVYSFGAITDQRDEGLQWVAPWQEIKFATVQVQGQKFPKLNAFSEETQDVFVDATINIQVSPKQIQTLYREVGVNYFDTLVRPRVLQAFKDETVKYKAVDIAPNRQTIRKIVRERLTMELSSYSITVEDLLLDNIAFSPKFQTAIEEKQANTQYALAARALVESKRAEADQAIETARGNAEAILINAKKQAEANKELAASITPAYIQYLFATKLAPNVNVMMVPMDQKFILNSDMLKPKQ